MTLTFLNFHDAIRNITPIVQIVEAYLSELYYSPKRPANVSNAPKLYDAAKEEGRYTISLKYIQKWLKSKETYTLNRSIQRSKPHSRVVVAGLISCCKYCYAIVDAVILFCVLLDR